MILNRIPALWLAFADAVVNLIAITYALVTATAVDGNLVAAVNAVIATLIALLANAQTPAPDGVALASARRALGAKPN